MLGYPGKPLILAFQIDYKTALGWLADHQEGNMRTVGFDPPHHLGLKNQMSWLELSCARHVAQGLAQSCHKKHECLVFH